ncbi:YybH family protein [Tautonia plasticadhaerens]|uniref:SnoaL-like domain protein n=1 Tax=Tautonia plasticadhaerens TaxID=2527974 RepID=A0A518HDU8_9BACT|nr:SgcJ/EcaC family oxidoreductase [Tautonia plasticadhaerens]QDV39013.1 SnoaL-like domain protein [Tautonia plasticadhaerens]
MSTLVLTLALLGLSPLPRSQEPQEPGAVGLAGQFADAFNRADATALAALFAPEAELVDEEGNLYRGREEISEILGRFFEAFPGASVSREVEEVRPVGPSLAIEDGVMTITSEGGETARNRYLAVLVKGEGGWRIASMRQVAEEAPPTPRDFLEPLAWLVGDWVSEGADVEVALSFRWSEDGNYLLGSYTIEAEGEASLATNQRIGWDAADQVIRSWNFDSDGGFSEGRWSTDGSAWVVKSELVLPEGLTGSATFYLSPVDEGHFVWSALDRVVAGEVRPDVEVTIVRTPPAPQE